MTRCKVADRNWKDIGSDISWEDHGGLWSRKLADGHYLVMRFENCEDWGDGATGYHVELSEVRLDNPQLDAALECCGFEVEGKDDEGRPMFYDAFGTRESVAVAEAMCVYALHSYGARAPLFQESGMSVWRLIRAAKSEAHRITRDASYLEDKLEQPVNAIGSTAAEYARGDLQSPILRGVMNGDPKAELMLKLGIAQHDGKGING